jgi:mannose-6-phosphate isomerase-like protein (cupin superfamily)
MTEQIKLISDRIKALREISGISTETLSKELAIPTKLLLDYESGTMDIPVSFLYKLAQKFDVELSVLLTGDNPRLHMFSIVRKGKGVSVERRKQYKYENLAYKFVNKKAEPFIVTVEPNNSDESAPLQFNSHPGQEFNYVLEGSMKLVINGHEIILNEGDSVYFDSSFDHAMQALNNSAVKFLTIVI